MVMSKLSMVLSLIFGGLAIIGNISVIILMLL